MDPALRTTPGLTARIEKLRDDLIKRFENIISYAAIEKKDRTLTAALQYQVQVETAALIRAAQELQTLIRTLQEMWLFGQLNTLGEDETQKKTDETAKDVADLLRQLVERQSHAGEIKSEPMQTGD